VDNGSTDGSLDHIAAWARGEQAAVPIKESMARFSQPACPKPIPFERIGPADTGRADLAATQLLTLVEAGKNLGFAGGNNLGLRLLMADRRIEWFWLLNNDTVIEPNAAEALVRRMATTHGVGMCGTVVRYYHDPDTVQALNGHRFNIWTGQSQGIGARKPISTPFDPKRVVDQTDFVLGASLAVSRPFLEAIGPMEDRYFLYYEEIDWAARNDRRFAIGFAHGATVFHKEGGTIGSSGVPGARSLGSEYWLTRSRLAFIRRNRIWLLPWHWLVTLSLIARRLLKRQPRKAIAITRALFGMGPGD
jgi:GT2 family glycosyltransferase